MSRPVKREGELFSFSFKRFYFFIFREGRKEGEREGEENINAWLPFTCPLLGTWPTTQARVLAGNRTGHPLFRRPALHPLSHTSQAGSFFLESIRLMNSKSQWAQKEMLVLLPSIRKASQCSLRLSRFYLRRGYEECGRDWRWRADHV